MKKNKVLKEIRNNRKKFYKILSLGSIAIKLGLDRIALSLIQAAAHYAWLNFTGEYFSIKLEKLLKILGSKYIKNCGIKCGENSSKRLRILHVITKAPSIGGCPRFVKNWIEIDRNNFHSLFITQSDTATTELINTVHKFKGETYYKDNDLLKTAIKLNKISDAYNIVVLHIHPYDIVPNLAFSNNNKKIFYNNHADHVFWVGLSITSVLINLRKSGEKLSKSKRNISNLNFGFLPIPICIDSPTEEINYKKARNLLGIKEHETLAITIASEYKFSKVGKIDFVDDHLQIIKKYPLLKIIAIGPRMKGRWKKAYKISQGRLKAIGPRKDLYLFRQASDIVIDSYPFSSLTSMLESLLHKKIGLSMIIDKEGDVSRFDDISFDNKINIKSSRSDYDKTIYDLINNKDWYNNRCEELFNAVANHHTNEGWLKYLLDLYALKASNNSKLNKQNIDINKIIEDWEILLYMTQKSGNENYGVGLCLLYEVGNISGLSKSLFIVLAAYEIIISPFQINRAISYAMKNFSINSLFHKSRQK
jgi:hypothetical protein